MSRHLEFDSLNYCPNAKYLYDGKNIARGCYCEYLWDKEHEFKECDSLQTPDGCPLKV